MFKNFEFDTLYHEHFSFFCPNSLTKIAERAGLPRARFITSSIHGGSLIAFLGRNGAAIDKTFGSVAKGKFFIEEVNSSDRPTRSAAQEFEASVRQTTSSINTILSISRRAGLKVVLVGAAAKAVTVLQASGADFDSVVDEAPLKIGKYIPGTKLMIESFDTIRKQKSSCIYVIGAWNFKDELLSKIRALRDPGDYFLLYFPRIEVGKLSD